MNGFMSGPQLAELLGRSARAAFDELEGVDADVLLSENLDVLMHGLLTRHMPEPVSVDWTAVSGTPVQESTIERTVREFGEQRDYRIPGSRVTISWPLTGTAEILRRRASQFTLALDRGTIRDVGVAGAQPHRGAGVVLGVVLPQPTTAARGIDGGRASGARGVVVVVDRPPRQLGNRQHVVPPERSNRLAHNRGGSTPRVCYRQSRTPVCKCAIAKQD